MSLSKADLYDLLERFDGTQEFFYEHAVSHAIRQRLREQNVEPDGLDLNLRAEMIAFDFCPARVESTGVQETYYRPGMAFTTESGERIEIPNIRDVTPEILECWGKRARSARNARMRMRDADLLWDISPQVMGKRCDIGFAQAAIDAALEIANSAGGNHVGDTQQRLKRALTIAISVSDARRITLVRDAIVVFEQRTAQNDHLGTWGFAFDILAQNRKVSLSDEQRSLLVSDLEARLTRVSGEGQKSERHPHAAEHAAMKLARYYQRLNRMDDVHRVLRLFGKAFMHWADQATPSLAWNARGCCPSRCPAS